MTVSAQLPGWIPPKSKAPASPVILKMDFSSGGRLDLSMAPKIDSSLSRPASSSALVVRMRFGMST